LNRTRELLARLDDAETGQRGYLLTGNPAYLQPYRAAELDASKLTGELQFLFRNDPRQQSRTKVLAEKIAQKFDELRKTIALSSREGFDTAIAMVRQNKGKQLMDDIRTIVATMEKDESDRLAAVGAVERRSSNLAMAAAAGGNLIAIALLGGATFVIRRQMADRERADAILRKLLGQLTRKNKELEQFAYVASHDLQEPLRMVANYCQLLQRRYEGRFDADADEFIGFAVDGARRMQTLIDDLLAFSRIGTEDQPAAAVDAESCLHAVKKTMAAAITASHAAITHDPLPIVAANETEVIQLFQNLLGNAIKFRGEAAPAVHVSVQRQGGNWLFGVRDNGIGISAEYCEQIFVIFQRLHSRNKYPGTGIGLAICKKIVERYGGKIWVESVPGFGSTFHFTLPHHAETSPATR
jgi:signal transduction histidine kinase